VPNAATLTRPKHQAPTLEFKEFQGRVLDRKAAPDAPEDYIREALVAVTGNEDDGGDIIQPGAFDFKRRPKIVWSHDLRTLVGKVLEYEEWLPGDSRIAEAAPDLAAKGLGALWFRIEFDPQDPESFKAFRKVDFHEDLGWSIGYETPADGFKVLRTGQRLLTHIYVWEGSPTTFGMNLEARTVNAKSLIDQTISDLELPEAKATALRDLVAVLATPEEKTYPALAGSFEETRDRLDQAIQAWAAQVYGDRDAENDWWASIEGTFENQVVATVRVYSGDSETTTYRFPYVQGEDGSVELGEAEEVEVQATVEPADVGTTPPADTTATTPETATLDLSALDGKVLDPAVFQAAEGAIEEAKAGRVVSAANLAALTAAVEAIQKVVSAATPKDDEDEKKPKEKTVIARTIAPKGAPTEVEAPPVEVPEGKVLLSPADLLEMELQTS
jgi:hypothetical protein